MQRVDERRAEDARLVSASRAGDPSAFAALFDRWFDRCSDVAWRILHDRDAAADIAQESFVAAWQGLDGLRDPASFGGWVLRTARNRALDRLARDRRAVVVGDDHLARAVDGSPRTDETAAAVTRSEDADLVWAASAALGERDTSILDLHLRHELAVPEIAEALGVTPNNAHQLLFRLRKRLSGAIRAWVLWREGEPACAALAGALAAAGVTRFGADAVRVTARHVPDCGDCDRRQHLRLAPEALFAAVPIGIGPPDVRASVASALRADGIPAEGPGRGTAQGADGPAGHPAGATRSRQHDPERDPHAPHLPHRSPTARALVAAGAVVVVVVGLAAAVAATRPEPALRAVDAGGQGPPGNASTATSAPAVTPGPAPATASPPAATGAIGDADSGAATPAPTTPSTGTWVPAPGDTAAAPGGGAAATATATAGPALGGGDSAAPAAPSTAATPATTDAEPTTATTVAPDPAEPEAGARAPEPPPAAPEVLRFTATAQRTAAPCGSGQRRVALAWEATGASGASVTGPGVPESTRPATGTAMACVPGSGLATFTLTATGPGGTVTATASA